VIERLVAEARSVGHARELVDRDGPGVDPRPVALVGVVVGASAADVAVAIAPDEQSMGRSGSVARDHATEYGQSPPAESRSSTGLSPSLS
jgi:hypothetical protein